MREAATGVTVADVRGMLAGIPSLAFIRATGMQVIEDSIIQENILAAESMVGTQLDVLLGIHEVRCTQAPAPDDYPDDVIYRPAIDKPRNWFEQDRWGAIGLPLLPVKEVLEIKVYPSGWSSGSFTIPVDRVRFDRKGFQIASSAMSIGGLTGWVWGGQSLNAPLSMMMSNDGRAMPGGIEVTYRAGLSKREIEQYPLLSTLVRLQALILTLTFYQSFLGGGAQKEQAGVDGMTNTVELAKRDVLGALGGELKAMKSSYNDLLAAARMRFGAVATVWM